MQCFFIGKTLLRFRINLIDVIEKRVATLQERIRNKQISKWWTEGEFAMRIGESIAPPEFEPHYDITLSLSPTNWGGVLPRGKGLGELRRALEEANQKLKTLRSGRSSSFIDLGLWSQGLPKGPPLF